MRQSKASRDQMMTQLRNAYESGASIRSLVAI
ncbi:MAG TPA: transcriptional regulator, partial [Mycobacterium sp.]